MTTLKKTYYTMGAMMTVGMTAGVSSSASAAAGGNNFSNISANIAASIADVPGLLSAMSYLFGILLGVLGVMKIKDHVENPSNTPLKDGAIRLAAGGALFALPIIYEAMFSTVGTGVTTQAATLKKVSFQTS